AVISPLRSSRHEPRKHGTHHERTGLRTDAAYRSLARAAALRRRPGQVFEIALNDARVVLAVAGAHVLEQTAAQLAGQLAPRPAGIRRQLLWQQVGGQGRRQDGGAAGDVAAGPRLAAHAARKL